MANFDSRVPNLLNLLDIEEFLDILGIQVLQVLLCIFSPDSETSDLYLLLQVFPCLCPVEHPFAIPENSTLRRDWNFLRRQVSLRIQLVDLKL